MADYHVPVLLNEVLEYLQCKPAGVYVDGTVGGGGHAKAICERIMPGGLLIGIDRDEEALLVAKESLKEYKDGIKLIKGNYGYIKDIVNNLGIESTDGILLDLGVSSHQLEEPHRGFSYKYDVLLDMRMDRSQALTARDVVNTYEEEKLYNIIRDYGEERWAKRIASFIVNERQRHSIETTGQLVEIIKNAIPAATRRSGPNPAKRTFQAIRIEVNQELYFLDKGLEQAMELLKPGGRLCVISFHSLEDRMVKEKFKRWENPCICPADAPICSCGQHPKVRILTRKPVLPLPAELNSNPRSRSAKLRACEKLAV